VLTKLEVKQLAYKFAKNKNICMPINRLENEAAGNTG